MCGYSKTRFVNSNQTEIEELICGICLGVFKNPVDTKCCRKTFCKQCISDWINQKNSCPNDRSNLNANGLTESSNIVLNLLAKLLIQCEYSEYGCTKVVRFDSLEKHKKECDFNKCKNCDSNLGNIVDHNCEQNLKEKITKQNGEIEALNQRVNYLNDINAKQKAVLKNHQLIVCYKCGGDGHLASFCYAVNKVCYKCGDKGHIAIFCNKSSLVFQSKNKINETSSSKSGEEVIETFSDVKPYSELKEFLQQIEEENDVNKILNENEVKLKAISDISPTNFTHIMWIISLIIAIFTVLPLFIE